MLFRTHVVSFLFLFLLIFEKLENPLIFLFVGLFATVLPDIDSSNSKIGKKGISKILTAFSKHRGIFHSLIFVGIVYFFLWKYFYVISFGFLIGYCLHLFLDCFTKRGVKLFYPFKFRIKGILKSGGRFESFLFLLLGLGVLISLYFNLYSLLV
ncbi:MAG: metal-dependent hydrolase [Nanoarchaeota archaeon]|nr:metal-dependent hydrolase [Nanoarchaeota archaeon]